VPEPPTAHDGDVIVRLPDNADVDRAWSPMVGRIWHRLVEAIAHAQKQMLNKS
jgi:hypothetical protein